MGGKHWMWGAVVLAGLAGAVGCGEPVDEGPVSSGFDAGETPQMPQNPVRDAGRVDAGDEGPFDGGSDGGTDGGSDGGNDEPFDGGSIELPNAPGWTFYGPQHGGPRHVFGVTMDRGGNLWVAGGADGLFLLEPGASRYQRFTVEEGLSGYMGPNGLTGLEVISVAGGPADTVFVGYMGVHGGAGDADPEWMVSSGDADRVNLNADGTLSVQHYDIASAAGEIPSYPERRDKIRNVYRIVYDPVKKDVWFGGNHGVAMYQDARQKVWEHEHESINGYLANGSYTLLSGDWWGVTLDAAGDLWMGGGHRVAKLNYATQGDDFYASRSPVFDVWPDADPADARPEDRTDDFVQDMAITPGGSVWVGSIPNGLARIAPDGSINYQGGMVDPKVTALEADPRDGSLWVGHIWGGISRIKSGQVSHYDYTVLGVPLTEGLVNDIQSTTVGGSRKILVAFTAGAVGIYEGD